MRDGIEEEKLIVSVRRVDSRRVGGKEYRRQLTLVTVPILATMIAHAHTIARRAMMFMTRRVFRKMYPGPARVFAENILL